MFDVQCGYFRSSTSCLYCTNLNKIFSEVCTTTKFHGNLHVYSVDPEVTCGSFSRSLVGKFRSLFSLSLTLFLLLGLYVAPSNSAYDLVHLQPCEIVFITCAHAASKYCFWRRLCVSLSVCPHKI